MQGFHFLCLIIFPCTIKVSVKAQLSYVKLPEKQIADAVVEIITNSKETRAECNVYGLIDIPNNIRSSEVKAEIVEKTFSKKIPMRVETLDLVIKPTTTKRSCSFFLVEVFDDFLSLYKNLNNEKFKRHAFFIIVLIDGTIDEIKQIFEMLWHNQMFNTISIYRDKISVKIQTV